tara:strand:- start:563 stop:3778 length:3216 start_codon:yes stop_codon:yes gene_type:complete
MVRFDINNFTSSGVTVMDVSAAANNPSLAGFVSGFAGDGYGYLVPDHTAPSGLYQTDGTTESNVVRFPTTEKITSLDLSLAKADPDLTGFKGGFAHDNSGYLIPGGNGKVVEFSTSGFSANNVNVIDFSILTGDASLVEFSGGFKDKTHGYLIPETFNKVARFDLSNAKIITSFDISVNGKDVSGFSGGFISGDYGYLIPNKSNELVRFSTNQTKQMKQMNDNIIINSDDNFTLNTFKSEDPITIDKNRSYNLRIDFSYLMAVDQENIPYEDVSMMVEIKPFSDISYFYNYDNSGSAGPGQSDDISNVVRITDLSYSEAFNFTFARKSASDLSMMITLRDNCNNDTAGNAVYKVIDFDVSDNNAAEEGNFDATYELALRDRNDLSFVNDIHDNELLSLVQNRIVYSYLNSNGLKLFDEVNRLKLITLYYFTSHTFTNAGKTGRFGPTLFQLRNAYAGASWASNSDFFNLGGPLPVVTRQETLNGFQLWTVPETAIYKITAKGAMGGTSYSTERGGRGGLITAYFNLTMGTKIVILVGQRGGSSTSESGGGGGGGATFILKENFEVSSTADYFGTKDEDIYMIVGGGGGATRAYGNSNLRAGDAEMYTSGGGFGGSTGPSYGSGGGAGYYGPGNQGYADAELGGGRLANVNEFYGFPGGNVYSSGNYGCIGGFGGGGASRHHEGAGGGGYQGGDVGNYGTNNPHGGGHTYVSPTAITHEAHITHSDEHGSVMITKREGVPEAELYSFTTATFTVSRSLSNSSSSDAHRTGPTLAEVRSWLSGTSNGGGGHSWANTYVESGGFQGYQKWTIPKTGKYQIIAKGGGSGYTDSNSRMRGVKVTAEFPLIKNNKLIIVVGQGVPDFFGDNCNGGGGASWVMSGSDYSTAIPLVVANGAGGDTSDGGGPKIQPNVTLGTSFSITHAGVTTTGKQTTPINRHNETLDGYGGTNPSAPNSGGWLSSGGNGSTGGGGFLTGLQGGSRGGDQAGAGGFGGGSGGIADSGNAGGGFTGAYGSDPFSIYTSLLTGHGSSYVNNVRESTPTVQLAYYTTTYQADNYTSEYQYQGWVKITFVGDN